MNGKMAAVSVMRMRIGSYAHIIALFNFGTRNLKCTPTQFHIYYSPLFPRILEVNMSHILRPTGQKLGMAHILLPLGYHSVQSN